MVPMLAPLRLLTLSFAASMDNDQPKLVVVFGRPGSGKTTVANKAIEILESSTTAAKIVGLDLDVCIPQWMKDNFSKGIYPTLVDRLSFAKSACDYVSAQLCRGEEVTRPYAIVSFSFVNTDLRDVFRSRFPQAEWVLINTSEHEARRRIEKREGHFYVGKVSDQRGVDSKPVPVHDEQEGNNSDWEFAEVEFPHTILDGTTSIEENAETIVDMCKAMGLGSS